MAMATSSKKKYLFPTKPRVPRLVILPAQKVAFITAMGDPNEICGKVLPALYSTVFGLKKVVGKDFKVGKLMARWPEVENLPKGQWLGLYALPIPEKITVLPPQNKVPGVKVKIETWKYGTVAELLHLGPYTEEGPSFEILDRFIVDNGFRKIGPHEEVYLSDPRKTSPDKLKTILRCRLEKA